MDDKKDSLELAKVLIKDCETKYIYNNYIDKLKSQSDMDDYMNEMVKYDCDSFKNKYPKDHKDISTIPLDKKDDSFKKLEDTLQKIRQEEFEKKSFIELVNKFYDPKSQSLDLEKIWEVYSKDHPAADKNTFIEACKIVTVIIKMCGEAVDKKESLSNMSNYNLMIGGPKSGKSSAQLQLLAAQKVLYGNVMAIVQNP